MDEEYEGWNSKKWRELFIVNEDIISAVKQYPYENDFFERGLDGALSFR